MERTRLCLNLAAAVAIASGAFASAQACAQQVRPEGRGGEEKLEAARQALSAGRLSDAAAAAREARTALGEDARAYLVEGTALRLRADFDAAEAALSRALALDGESAEARLQRGLLYLRRYEADAGFLTPFLQQHGPIDLGPTKDTLEDAERWKKPALEDLRAVPADKVPAGLRPLVTGGIAFLEGAYQKALDAFALAPDHLETVFWRGRVLQLAGQHADTVSLAGRYLERFPEDPHAWIVHAISRLAEGEFAEAVEDIGRATRADPRCVHAWYTLGLAHHARAYGQAREDAPDFRPALEAYTRAVEADPTFPGTYLTRSLLLMHDQQLDRAMDDLTTFIKLKPRAPIGYNRRASIHLRRNDSPQAIADYTKAIELDPRYYYGYTNRAQVYMTAEQWAEAAADYTKALELQPNQADCYANRGLCYSRSGKPYEAMKDFERAIRLQPAYEESLKELLEDARRRAREY